MGPLHILLVLWPASTLAWDYSQNGRNWALGLCAGPQSFTAQSPIDLSPEARKTEARQVFLKYPRVSVPLTLYNNGHTLAMTVPEAYKGGFGFVPKEEDLQDDPNAAAFRLWQVSFHAPSEHTLAGKRMPLEMQMVHQRVTGGSELAVVSILFEAVLQAEAPFLGALLRGGLPLQAWDEVPVNLAAPAGSSDIADDPFGFQRLLSGSAFFAYEGSLTVPPCETGVKYFVRQKPVVASPHQLLSFSKALLDLCPPLGNFRSQPSFSTAALELVLVSAVDTISGQPAATPAPPRTRGQASSAARRAVVGNPDFEDIKPDDTQALRKAKQRYQHAKLDQQAAAGAKATAFRELQHLQDLFQAAGGHVAKIDAKWKVMEAQKAYNLALRREAEATQAVQDAINYAMKMYQSDLAVRRGMHAGRADGIASIKTTTPFPTEFGSDGRVVTTSIPYHEGIPMRARSTAGPLQYTGEVALPRGKSASPFSSESAQTEVNIGQGKKKARFGGPSSVGGVKLAPNLRQFDGPATQLPTLRAAWNATSIGQDQGRPPPAQLRVVLPIPYKSIPDTRAFSAQLAHAVAADAGIPEASVSVPDMRGTRFSMQALAPRAELTVARRALLEANTSSTNLRGVGVRSLRQPLTE